MIIQGIVPPLVTPLADRDSLDQAGLERLISSQIAAGVDGLFVLGTTGEGPGLGQSLQRAMIRESSRLVGGKIPLYVGITDTSLTDAIELAQVACDAGATAVVAAPPFYFPAGQTELQHWFHELADAVPLPLLLYNMPGCVRIVIEEESLSSLIQHPNILGLKDSSGDLDYFATCIQLARTQRPDWPVLMGPEAMLPAAMELGAVGGVTGGANLCPRLFTDLFAAIRAGQQERVQQLAAIVDRLQELYRFGKYGSSYLKGLKCALDLTGVCSGLLAAPFDAFKAPERARVEAWLSEFSATGYLP
ncbi:MAG: dihydrodipicolinate synthase family protein [Planctomycetaceae bacterium]|nr:dihydrodipicolinate synthase family protein [Planctomycetaceae bacterium]